ncbi:MAG: thioredoxin [Candidatus Lightella neohaematopini]|nr:thioredoxin [Candidatus Lightella neohaematopini]
MNKDGVVLSVNDVELETYINTGKDILVDFWAEWCGPCKSFSPILEKVALDFISKILFLKINIDQNQVLTDKYNIRSVPSLILFRNSKLLASKTGLLSEDELRSFIINNLL